MLKFLQLFASSLKHYCALKSSIPVSIPALLPKLMGILNCAIIHLKPVLFSNYKLLLRVTLHCNPNCKAHNVKIVIPCHISVQMLFFVNTNYME